MNLFELQEKLTSIEERLSRIENRLQLSTPPPINPKIYPEEILEDFEPVTTNAKPGNWLGFIAVVCFVLAAGFIIKLSIDTGWLTPQRQLVIAACFGFGLIGAGFLVFKSDRAYASFLPGAGIIILYLTTFAAHNYYLLISFQWALILTGLVSLVCIWLYKLIKHDLYALTAAFGAYLSPVVLAMDVEVSFSLYYFLLCGIAFATISIWLESRLLILISAYLSILMTSLTGLRLQQDALVAGILAIQFLIFSASNYYYSRYYLHPLTEYDSWCYLPVLLLFYAMEYYFLSRIYPGFAPWLSLGFAVFIIGLYISAKRFFPDGLSSQSMIFTFVSIVCFHSIYLEILPDILRPWLLVIIILFAGFHSFTGFTVNKKQDFFIPMVLVLIIVILEYLSIITHLLDPYDYSWLPVTFAAFASIWFLIAFSPNKTFAKPTYGSALLVAAHLLAVLGLYRLSSNAGSLAISISWLLYAITVMVFAFIRRDETMAKSALLVLALAAGKALLYDAGSAPTLIRIVCLLLTGAVLYGCGLFMRKISSWHHTEGNKHNGE